MKSRGGFASLLLLSVIFFSYLSRGGHPANSLMMNLVPPLWTLSPSPPAPSAWQFPDHDAHRTTVNAENLLVTILSSVPPISTPLHARQELNLELYFLLVMFFLSCFWIDQFSVDGTGTWQGSLEKAKTRTGAHIYMMSCVCVCGGLVVNRISFLNIYRQVISSRRVKLDIDS